MRTNGGLVALSLAAAVALHLAGTLVFRSTTVAGMATFRADVAALAGRPELAYATKAEPIRVVLGRAERAPFESPGPRASLDPSTVRRPPSLGPVPPDDRARLAQVLRLFGPSASEIAASMAAELPDTGVPSWGDTEVSLSAIDLGLKPVTRRLGAHFVARDDLFALGKRHLLELKPHEAAKHLKLRPAPHELPIPTSWPEPDVALRVVEVFVDPME